MVEQKTPTESEDDLILRMWDGDDSAKGDILKAWGGCVLKSIRNAYPSLSEEDIEDVVCEAMKRFWVYRMEYDPNRAKVGTVLYVIAKNVAMEHISGRLNWQKAKLMEKGKAAEFFENILTPITEEDPPDDTESKQSPIQRALEECWKALPPLQQDILRAYGDAGSYPMEAATLGIELGQKHKQGTPIPGGTIRVNKMRGWDSIERCMKKKNHDISYLRSTNE